MQLVMHLTGRTPLLINSSATLDPTHPIAQAIKALTGKRNKTDKDYQEIARLEWFGALYHDPRLGIYVPAEWINKSLERAGTITKKGTTVNRAFSVTADRFPLQYDGPREPDALWKREEFRDFRPVGVQRNKVMRMRPIFRQWAVTVDAWMMEDVLNFAEFQEIARLAGLAEGIGDGRRIGMGRFDVEVIAA